MGGHLYRTLTRTVFGMLFIAGGFTHILLGRLIPEGYAVFGENALIPALGEFWATTVMPHIGWITLVQAAIEIACGIGLLRSGLRVRLAAAVILLMLLVQTLLGMGLTGADPVLDIAVNRGIPLILAVLAVPLLTGPRPPAFGEAWRRLFTCRERESPA